MGVVFYNVREGLALSAILKYELTTEIALVTFQAKFDDITFTVAMYFSIALATCMYTRLHEQHVLFCQCYVHDGGGKGPLRHMRRK